MNKTEYKVSIPEWALLTIAVHGNMGDGELPDMMKDWATGECKRLGLDDKLEAERAERYAQLRARLANLLGDDVIEKIDQEVSIAAVAIDAVRKVKSRKP